MARRLKHWGWGYEDEQLPPEGLRDAAALARAHLGFEPVEVEAPVPLESVSLPVPRLQAPPELGEFCRQDDHDRALHALGRSYLDVVRGLRGRFEHAPDIVAHPRDESEVERTLEWAAAAAAAVIAFGGGTSVVGGVEPRVGGGWAGVVTVDLRALDRVLEVDAVSRSARIQAGATGPRLERGLQAHGLTLRHYPQSFQFSTLGGWIATRAAGHFSTLETHIEDLLESVRAITPAGAWESRRLPGSGAGPSPDRLLAGSEGTLGLITEAWMRVRPRPDHRASRAVRFRRFADGVEAARGLAQSGLHPAAARLIDAEEARVTGAGDGSQVLLVLGFESADHPVLGAMERALEICAECGGEVGDAPTGDSGGAASSSDASPDGASSWRDAFLRAPYLRDMLVAAGVLCETFETAVTWERFGAFHESVTEAVEDALRRVCGAGTVTCRFTHLYPDGPAAYYTVLAPARRGDEADQWGAVKAAAGEAILAGGGTITHHHAVGRDHRPWYDHQRPEPFALALRGAKLAVDPHGMLNPGVLLDPLA